MTDEIRQATFDGYEARMARDVALKRLEATRAAWLARARSAAVTLYRALQRPITVDDVRDACPPPEEIDPRAMGAIFMKDWDCVGFRNSTRKECHARPIRSFVPKA